MKNKNKYKTSDDEFRRYVSESISLAEVIRRCGGGPGGGWYSAVNARIKYLQIDTSHFLGIRAISDVRHKDSRTPKIVSEKILVLGRLPRKEKAHMLRRALIDAGVDYLCSLCGIGPVWNNNIMVLEIDHINGNNIDNTKDNLRFLCPNCHSQTSNHGAKNITRKKGTIPTKE